MTVNLSENEKLVFNIVREYLEANRTFEIEIFQPFVKSRFKANSININIEGIELLLKSLVDKGLLVEGSRLSKKDVLLVDKRKKIFKYILDNPGAYLNKIIKDTGYSFNLVIWHLRILEKFNFIKKDEIENNTVYYDSGLELKKVKVYYFLNSNERSKKIVEYLKINNYGITKTQISSELNMHLNTVIKLIENLEKNKIIQSLQESSKTLYFLNEEITEII